MWKNVLSVAVSIAIGAIVNHTLGSLSAGVATGILSAMVGANLIHLKYTHKEQFDKIEDNFLKKLDNIIKHSALFTENTRFEKSLGRLADHKYGQEKWLIAKFISGKLNREFKNGPMLSDVGAQEYSRLQDDLIHQCKKSICLTSPFNPETWFQKMLEYSPGDFKKIEEGVDLEINKFPHLVAVKSSSANDKKRLVVLEEHEWTEMLNKEKRAYFEEFVRLSKHAGLTTRFVKINNLSSPYSRIEFKDSDYGIYENTILVRWEIKSGSVKLCLDQDDFRYFGELKELFDFNDATFSNIYKTECDIRIESDNIA